MKTISCGPGYGEGGLGRHLSELVEDARAEGSLSRYYTSSPQTGDSCGVAVAPSRVTHLVHYTPIRFSPGWSAFLGFDLFDRAAARRLEPAETHVAFSLQALRTFRVARRRGCQHLDLISPTCHIDAVKRRYAQAFRLHPIERSWLNDEACEKARREYLGSRHDHGRFRLCSRLIP